MVLDMLDNCHIIPVTIIRDYRGTKVEWGGADLGPRRCHKGSIDYFSRPRGMNITVDPTSPKPIYKQVVDGVRMAIALGSLKAGDRLPAIREMAVKTRVHRNTIVRAYQELEYQGLLRGRQGSGFYVTDNGGQRERSVRKEALLEKVHEIVVEARMADMTTQQLLRMVRKKVEEMDRKGGVVSPGRGMT